MSLLVQGFEVSNTKPENIKYSDKSYRENKLKYGKNNQFSLN